MNSVVYKFFYDADFINWFIWLLGVGYLIVFSIISTKASTRKIYRYDFKGFLIYRGLSHLINITCFMYFSVIGNTIRGESPEILKALPFVLILSVLFNGASSFCVIMGNLTADAYGNNDKLVDGTWKETKSKDPYYN